MKRTLQVITFLSFLVFGFILLVINQSVFSKNERLNDVELGFNSVTSEYNDLTDFRFPKELFTGNLNKSMKSLGAVNAPDQVPCDFTPVCSNETFSGDAPVGNPMGVIQSTCQTLESDDVTWYYVQIQSGTTFTFVISPQGNVDYDFAAWLNPDLSDCNNLGIADRASYDAPGFNEYDTGLMIDETDLCETASGGGLVGGMVRHFDVQAGDIIVIAVDKFSDNAPGFELSFGGDAVLDCSILGEAFYEECDNDNDGQVQFDLDSIATDLAEGDNTLQVTFYSTEEDATNDTGNNILSSPYILTEANSLIYAQIKDQNNEIVEIVVVSLTINQGVELLDGPFVLQVEGSGTGIFNLTSIQPSLVTNPSGYTFLYYEQEADANEGNDNNIATPTAYQASNGATVYVRVINPQGCFDVTSITLLVEDDCINPEAVCPGDDFGANIPFIPGEGNPIPEEAPDGPNYGCLGAQPYPRFYYMQPASDGSLNFYLNQYTEEDQEGTGLDVDFIVWGPFEEVPCDYADLQNVISCSFSAASEEYVQIPNAQQGEIYIMMITNYAGSYGQFGYVNLIFDEENSSGTFDCSILADYSDCDNDGDGQVQFDLNEIATDLAEGDNTLQITFYSNQTDAENDTGNNVLSSPYTVLVTDGESTIYAQIKNANGAIVEVVQIRLIVFSGPQGAEDVSDYYCDAGVDGTETVDLTSYNLIPNQNTYTLTYYETEQDAIEGNASFIPTPENYETGTTTVYVRIENAAGCFTIVEISIEVSGLQVDLGDNFSMCEGEFTLTAAGDFSEFTGVTFTWTRNGEVLPDQNTNTLLITQPGNYTVTVNTDEGCTGTDAVTVSPGESPVITAVNVGPDYVIVEAEGGVQPYEYSITGVVWQSSNQFNYLQPGTHTVYVRTAEGCIVSQEFVIFQIPTMFTPNGDGINDTWNIPGFDIYPQSNVVIYDRQGRLVYQSEITSNQIWNGFFMNGQKAPTQDYWYIINVSDGRKFTGHITVKSRGEKN